MTKLRHYDNLGTARFVTFNCYRELPSLNSNMAKELLIKYIEMARDKHSIKIMGYVIMPNHVHLVMLPEKDMKLGLVIREIKSRMAKEYFARMENLSRGAQRVFWQKRCYDHNCRTPETTKEKIIYCHNNPVRRGLVKSPGNWKWSSYNWCQGNKNVPLQMDEMEF